MRIWRIRVLAGRAVAITAIALVALACSDDGVSAAPSVLEVGQTSASTDERELILNATDEEWDQFVEASAYEDTLIRVRWNDVGAVRFDLSAVDTSDCRITVRDQTHSVLAQLDGFEDGPELTDGASVSVSGYTSIRIDECDNAVLTGG